MESNANQSAFPTIGEHSHLPEGGLTKREYFAAMAMQGLLSHTIKTGLRNPGDYARKAAELADALLKHLDQPQKAS